MENVLTDRYITEAANAVQSAVLYIAQTYVDNLKMEDKFTKENQETAAKEALAVAGYPEVCVFP